MKKRKQTLPISVSPWFWVLAAVIGWIATNGNLLLTFIWALVIAFSVLVHEMGHAITALVFRQKVKIQLVAFGGMTEKKGPKLKPWQEFLVVLNGPLAGLALFAVAYFFYLSSAEETTAWNYAVEVAVYINLFWSIINLVPVVPLDGGKLLSIVMEAVFGFKGIRIAFLLSIIIAVGIATFFFVIRAVLAGALFLLLAFESYRAWKQSQVMSVKDQDETLQKLLRQGQEDYHALNREGAWEKLQSVRQQAKSGMLFNAATEALAQMLSEEGHVQKAYDMLVDIEKILEGESLRLFHQLAYATGDWEKAVEVGSKAYQARPGYDVALVNAVSCALLEDVKPAVGWLRCAVREGLPNPKSVLTQAEFDKIREHPLFQEFFKAFEG